KDPVAKEERQPFEGTGRHAAMVARNALAYATNVKLWDCPLLPDRIDQLGIFLSYAQVVFGQIRDRIEDYRAANPGSGSWVLVNAWGIWDTSQDPQSPCIFNYGSNINHALNKVVAELDGKGLDQVFAAGNCGQFCPPTRCGPLDRGPGRSIHGANSHPDVLTVGGVRTDGLWVGYSAEGPGTLAAAKPDLCAPTLFRDVLAPFDGADNSGTSAACGVAAGIVASVRGQRPWNVLPPAALRAQLRAAARSQGGDPTSLSRFGAGILQAV
ncbi:MAG: S8 family serine peptidase, partial [Paracraurococcus sp.]